METISGMCWEKPESERKRIRGCQETLLDNRRQLGRGIAVRGHCGRVPCMAFWEKMAPMSLSGEYIFCLWSIARMSLPCIWDSTEPIDARK